LLALFKRRPPFEPIPFGATLEEDRAEAGSESTSRITVTSGRLSGVTFDVKSEVGPRKADFALTREGETAGHAHIDRDPETGRETLWDIFVHPTFRGHGLSSLMTRYAFRHLLGQGRRHWFGMRKLMQVDTRNLQLHNVGIGLIALRLGLRPEDDLASMLEPKHIKSVEVLDKTDRAPPGLLVRLARLPGVVVTADIDPETGHPETDSDRYRRFFSPEQLVRKAHEGRAVVGNIDYVLARGNSERFARHMAGDAKEFRKFTRSLNAGARRLNSD
jgi:GNAT superfamily N-acetyltransferase